MSLSPALSNEQCAQFAQQGYLVLPGAADASTIAAMRALIDRHLAQRVPPFELEAQLAYPGAPATTDAEGGTTIRRLLGAFDRDTLFQRWATSPLLREALTQLLGEAPLLSRAHHNCIMTKQPAYSSDTGWHQDVRYWSFEQDELVSVWLALGEERPDNGGLWFLPGSHRWTLQREQLDAAKFLRADLDTNVPLIATRRSAHLRAGDVVFFHARTFHAATRNNTQQTKFSLVFTYHGSNNAPLAGTRSAAQPEVPLG